MARGALPVRGARHRVTAQDMRKVGPADRHLLELLIRHRWPADDVSEVLGVSPERVLERAVAAVREIGGVGSPRPQDAELGAYLFSRAWAMERDRMLRPLWEHGEVLRHRLELVVEDIKRLPRKRWTVRDAPRDNGAPLAEPAGVLGGEEDVLGHGRPGH